MSPTTGRIKVIVADDDALVRRIIRGTLQEAGMVVVAEASTGRECIDLALHYRPHVLVVDLLMPEGDGIDVARSVRATAGDDIQVIILTSARDAEVGVHALRTGAAGYLSKDMDIADLPRAVHGAVNGEAVITRRMGRRLIERLRELPEGSIGLRPVKSPLTDREWEVLDLLCESMTTEDIASELVLSTETVRSHVKNILRKIGANSRVQAVAMAPSLRAPS
jgi:NarL family two-component system response regulator LiaR